jgi:hypothetical protein
MCATANLLNESKKNATNVALNQNVSSVRNIAAEMTQVPAELPARAHAAFLLAVCEKNATHPDSTSASTTASLNAVIDAARKLQMESIRAGHPGTVPRIFSDLIDK